MASSSAVERRFPLGAEVIGPDTASFRVWAPSRKRVAVVIDGEAEPAELELKPETGGYFSGVRPGTPSGALYRLRLDAEDALYPDPASRFQPHGHDGPSQVVESARYAWRDGGWRGAKTHGQVVYELHIGTFTPEGTWRAAAEKLPLLADIGVTLIELMPVGEFPGRFGWGYDVVHFFAPTRLYGTPDDMRAFVDAAHGLGIAVILDVIYNHCASVGCFLPAFTERFFSSKWRSDWGHALNFDAEGSEGVREFFRSNGAYWVSEFHLDGFRLDATQTIYDASTAHILGEISAAARAAADGRGIVIIAENEPQHVTMLRAPGEGGAGIDMLWNDDFHHSARVAATGRTEAYYTDYRGTPQELVSAAKHGFLYQGQYYRWQKKRRGTPTRGFDAAHLVNFLQNHDQVANSTRGLRLDALTTPGRFRAMTALLLLLPQTPMLFQGQEFGASSPFMYFADNEGDQARSTREGRREFLSQFQSVAAGGDAWLRDPASPEVFAESKLDWSEREQNPHVLALHRDLIALRKRDPVFSRQDARALDGAVLAEEAFVLRFSGEGGEDRLLLVNLGRQLDLTPYPEPLLAPPAGAEWSLVWSSEDVAYGGDGTLPPDTVERWNVPAHAALVFAGSTRDARLPPLPGQDES